MDIQEIINYRQAMGQAVESLEKRPLCLNLIKELHAVLLGFPKTEGGSLGSRDGFQHDLDVRTQRRSLGFRPAVVGCRRERHKYEVRRIVPPVVRGPGRVGAQVEDVAGIGGVIGGVREDER